MSHCVCDDGNPSKYCPEHPTVKQLQGKLTELENALYSVCDKPHQDFSWQEAYKILGWDEEKYATKNPVRERDDEIRTLQAQLREVREENHHLRERLGFPGEDKFAELSATLEKALEALKEMDIYFSGMVDAGIEEGAENAVKITKSVLSSPTASSLAQERRLMERVCEAALSVDDGEAGFCEGYGDLEIRRRNLKTALQTFRERGGK